MKLGHEREKFGDFQIKEKDGTWIITEPAWREKNIDLVDLTRILQA